MGTPTQSFNNYPWLSATTIPSASLGVPLSVGDAYANEVVLERGEHDATLRFYRTREETRSLVKVITVPLGRFIAASVDCAEAAAQKARDGGDAEDVLNLSLAAQNLLAMGELHVSPAEEGVGVD